MKKLFLLFFIYGLQYNLCAQSGAVNAPLDTTGGIVHPALNESPDLGHSTPDSIFRDPEVLNTFLVSGLFLIVIALILYRKRTDALSGEEYVRLIGIIVVIFGALFVLAAGWSKEHAAPVYGLLGTVAGFLLGRQSNTA